MKTKLWSGVLPRYWTESQWMATLGRDIVLLVPERDRRVLVRVTNHGEPVWRETTTSGVVLASDNHIILTARMRDGRSHAVFYQFAAYEGETGRLSWALPPQIETRRSKGGVPAPTIQHAGSRLVQLDSWRDLCTGLESAPTGHLSRTYGLTTVHLDNRPNCLMVQWEGHSWGLPACSSRQVLGIKGSVLVGFCGTQLWARSLVDGHLVWQVEFDGTSASARDVIGLDDRQWSISGSMVLAAALLGERVAAIRNLDGHPILFEEPTRRQVAAWKPDAFVALVGTTADGYLVVEEHSDGTGCMWFAQ